MTNAVQLYTGISAGILGATALSLGVPFLLVALPGLGLCYGFQVTNSQENN